jgi:hypothetical protein
MKLVNFIVLSFLISGTFACSTNRLVVNLTSDVIKEGLPTFYAEKDLELARRGLEANLKLLDVFQHTNPDNPVLKTMLAQAYGGYGYIFVETDMISTDDKEKKKYHQDRAIDFYTRGKDFGLSVLMEYNSRFKKAIQQNDLASLMTAAGSFGKSDIYPLFWTCFNWALLINIDKTNVDEIAQLPKLKILLDRLVTIDPTYFYSSSLALKATIDAALPRMLGGKPAVAQKLFEQAITDSGGKMLLIQLLYGQYGAPALQDKKLFRELFAVIEKTDLKIAPDIILINSVAKIKARALAKSLEASFIEEDENTN